MNIFNNSELLLSIIILTICLIEAYVCFIVFGEYKFVSNYADFKIERKKKNKKRKNNNAELLEKRVSKIYLIFLIYLLLPLVISFAFEIPLLKRVLVSYYVIYYISIIIYCVMDIINETYNDSLKGKTVCKLLFFVSIPLFLFVTFEKNVMNNLWRNWFFYSFIIFDCLIAFYVLTCLVRIFSGYLKDNIKQFDFIKYINNDYVLALFLIVVFPLNALWNVIKFICCILHSKQISWWIIVFGYISIIIGFSIVYFLNLKVDADRILLLGMVLIIPLSINLLTNAK